MDDSDAQAAFITAGLVLLVLPVLYLVGLAAIFVVLTVSPWAGEKWLMVTLSAVWAFIVVAVVLMLARRVIRRAGASPTR